MTDAAASRRTNRRLTARMTCQLTVRYRSGKEWHPATAMDMSHSGCRLRLGQDLPRGQSLTVRVEHAGRDGAPALGADVPGCVIWSRLEGLSHQAGIQFSADSEDLHRVLLALG